MTIKSVVNPVDDSTITIAEGVVEKITYKDKVDNFGNTHSAGLLVDGNWINIALKTKEGYQPQVRFAKGQPGKQTWETLNEGDTVKIVVKPNEWNGKTYYSTTSSKINVTKKGEGQPAQQQRAPQGSQNASSSFKKDNHEVVAGNARTAAFAYLKGIPYENVSDVNDLVQKFARYSDKKRKQYKEEHPELDDFQVGVSVGQAVVLAAPLAKDFDALDVIVDDILGSVIPYSVGIVKGIASGELTEEQPKQQAKPAQKAKPQPKPVEQEPEDDFEDQDLPF